jgi:hypothetical protein
MLSNRKIVVLGLTVVALFLLSGATVSAAEPIPGVQPYEIKLVVDEQGGWAIPSLGGLDLGLNSATFASVANTLGLQMQVPTLDPALVQMAVDNDVQTLALIKEGDLHTVLVNNQPVTAVTLTDDALALVAGFVPELETLIGGLNRTYVAVGVQFPADGAAVPLDLDARLGAPAAAPASATMVDLGVTVSPEGELLSVGGMDPAQFGVALPMVDVSILETLGMDRLDAKLTAGGMSVIANDVELATVNWDPAQVENLPAIYTKLTGAGLPAGADSVVEVATGWLMDSQINLTAYVADTPQEDRPHLALGRPLMVSLAGDSLSVEGFAVRTGFEPVIAQYQAKLGAIALSWDGDEGKLTPVIGDKVMPSVQIDAGFLDVVGGTFLGGAMDWGMISESLGMADVTVALGAEGAAAPDLSLLSYEPMPTRSAFMTTSNIKISRTTGEVAVLGTTLPLDFVEALTGLEITEIVRQQVGPLGGVDSLDVRLGPNGLALTLNGETATVAWDEQTRDNLIALAVDLLVGDREAALPAGGLMQDPVNTLMAALKMADLGALQDAVGALNQGQVGFTVEFADEALPESTWTGTLAGLEPLLDLVAPAS